MSQYKLFQLIILYFQVQLHELSEPVKALNISLPLPIPVHLITEQLVAPRAITSR